MNRASLIFRASLSTTALSLVAAGCANDPSAAGSRAGLRLATSCTDVIDAYRASLRTRVDDEIDETRKSLRERWAYRSESCWYHDSPDASAYEYDGYGGADAGSSGLPAPAAPQNAGDTASDSDGAEREHSETNTQVAGVDEADLMKNDGDYIYLLADGALQIIDAWPAEEAHLVSRTPIDGNPKSLFVNEGRALVYSSIVPEADPSDPYGYGDSRYGYGYGGDCTYGYDCDFTGDGLDSQISVFDINDLENPELLRKVEFSGSYINSRRIGDDVYTVVSFATPAPYFDTYTYVDVCSYDWQFLYNRAIEEALSEKRDAAYAQIDELDLDGLLPHATDTLYADGDAGAPRDIVDGCSNAYLAETGDAESILLIAGMKLATEDAIDVTTILGKPGAVYASMDSLYIASRHDASNYGYWGLTEDAEADPEATTIHKFQLDAGTTEYLGSGAAKGRILNQFAMDELDGYLRIATTTGHLPDPNAHNTLSVLAQEGSSLEVVGVVDNIAPTEDIRSVRFVGETGYIVTFKKTDPLFTLDLSDPRDPKIVGELKIPGFSTYIHPVDATHLLSIGYDADDQGDFAWFQGIQLQLFDVSDLADPQLTQRLVIGSRGTASEAATNHLAFNYFAHEGWLAVPITVCEGGSGGSFGDELTFSGLQIYSVDVDSGFDLLGGVPHVDAGAAIPPDPYGYGSEPSCYQWWSGATSAVKRSVFIENFVYSIATDAIEISNVSDLESPVAHISLMAPAIEDPSDVAP